MHTSFSLAATTTGRLSSSEPNLQNIPIRTEAGRKIRTRFRRAARAEDHLGRLQPDRIASAGAYRRHSAIAGSVRAGIDIHAATASAMFGVPLDQMTADLRRQAKTINFGIIYGISAFGLAQRLGIPHGEAAAFIRQYFERFPGIRTYIDDTKKAARENGYVTTLFGRVCHYPQIKSGNPNERAGVERQAINAPIQGTAADIIRRAMVAHGGCARKPSACPRACCCRCTTNWCSRRPTTRSTRRCRSISRVMTEAPFPAVTLKVPLAVDARAAQNWDEAH